MIFIAASRKNISDTHRAVWLSFVSTEAKPKIIGKTILAMYNCNPHKPNAIIGKCNYEFIDKFNFAIIGKPV